MLYHAFEDQSSVSILRWLFLSSPVRLLPPADGSFRVGHESKNGAFFVADPGYVMECAIGVDWESAFGRVSVFVAVAENKHVFIIESIEEFLFSFSGE